MTAKSNQRLAPTPMALIAWAVSLVALAAMIGVAHLGLGAFAPIAIIALAAVQAGLVLWVFMHLRRASRLVRYFAFGVGGWLLILFALSFLDWMTRN